MQNDYTIRSNEALSLEQRGEWNRAGEKRIESSISAIEKNIRSGGSSAAVIMSYRFAIRDFLLANNIQQAQRSAAKLRGQAGEIATANALKSVSIDLIYKYQRNDLANIVESSEFSGVVGVGSASGLSTKADPGSLLGVASVTGEIEAKQRAIDQRRIVTGIAAAAGGLSALKSQREANIAQQNSEAKMKQADPALYGNNLNGAFSAAAVASQAAVISQGKRTTALEKSLSASSSNSRNMQENSSRQAVLDREKDALSLEFKLTNKLESDAYA